MHNFRPTILDGRGAVHIDRIVNECITNRLDIRTIGTRLYVAALLAEVLDNTQF